MTPSIGSSGSWCLCNSILPENRFSRQFKLAKVQDISAYGKVDPVTDQSALYGLVAKLRDLGMALVQVSHVELEDQGPPRSTDHKEG